MQLYTYCHLYYYAHRLLQSGWIISSFNQETDWFLDAEKSGSLHHHIARKQQSFALGGLCAFLALQRCESILQSQKRGREGVRNQGRDRMQDAGCRIQDAGCRIQGGGTESLPGSCLCPAGLSSPDHAPVPIETSKPNAVCHRCWEAFLTTTLCFSFP